MLLLCIAASLSGYIAYSLFTVATRFISSLLFFWILLAIGVIVSDKENLQLEIKTRLNRFAPSTVIIAAVLLVMFFGIAKTTVAYYVSDVHLKTAYDAASAKQFLKARRALNRAIALRPRSVEAYYQRGYVRFMRGEHDKALDDYRKVQEFMPHYLNTEFNMASCYYAQRDWPNAIRMAHESNTIFPGYFGPLRMLAFCYYYTMQPEKALDYCNKLLAIDRYEPKGEELKETLENILANRKKHEN